MNFGTSRPIDWKKYAAVTISVSAALFAFWVFMRYGIGVLMPFLISWALSLLLTPISDKLAEKTKLPRKLCAAAVLLLALSLLVLLVVLGLNRIFREIEDFLRFLSEDSERLGEIIQQIVDYFSEIGNKIPFLSALGEIEALEALVGDVGARVNALIMDTLSNISARIPAVFMKILSATPEALLFLLVFLLSAFYFCLDGDRIYGGIRILLPPALRERLGGFRTRLSGLLFRYLRVYLVLFLVTFTELLVGFMLLGRSYAFLLAFLISAMDILPVLGVGTVLLPWAAILFLTKDFHGAVGLLILWGVITIVRQILEPRLIGDSFGMHPLVALIALYAGLRLFGFVGLLLGPAVAVFIKLVLEELRGAGSAPKPPNSC